MLWTDKQAEWVKALDLPSSAKAIMQQNVAFLLKVLQYTYHVPEKGKVA